MTEDRGTYRQYVEKRLGEDSLTLIGLANRIIDEYEGAGHSMTVRQLYYQLVARDVVPNNQSSYDRVKRVISDGRLVGLVSWTAIEDRTRGLKGLGHHASPGSAVRQLASSYRRDLWENQPMRVEVWVEKEALAGVVESICLKERINFFSCRGYSSQSEQWRAGQRFARYIRDGQRPIVLHLGDHDPSGIDMTRDNEERLSLFAGVPIAVQRIALNWEQIEELKPPPNPAKSSDSRFEDYRRKFGSESWELDALSPEYLTDLVRRSVTPYRDPDRWEEALRREEDEILLMEQFAEEQGQ